MNSKGTIWDLLASAGLGLTIGYLVANASTATEDSKPEECHRTPFESVPTEPSSSSEHPKERNSRPPPAKPMPPTGSSTWEAEVQALGSVPGVEKSPRTVCEAALCVAIWTTESNAVTDVLPSMLKLSEIAAGSGVTICTRARLVGTDQVVIEAFNHACDASEGVQLRAYAMADDIVETAILPQDTATP